MPPRLPIADSLPATADGPLPLASETFSHLSIEARPDEILRCLGYPRSGKPSPALMAAIEKNIAEALPQLHPRGTYSIYHLAAQTPRTLTIGGAKIRGHIGEFLHGARRIAVFMVTAGNDITRLADARCHSGDTFGGWVLDAVGSWAAEAAVGALLSRLAARLAPDEGLTMRYSPGYCGMDLKEQRTLFRLAQAEGVGIVLGSSLLMEPLKSVSGIVGLGPRAVVGINLSPCERCPLTGCHMRR